MSETLKPCPFCGAVPEKSAQHGYRVRCHECGACGPEATFKKARGTAWNNRPATAHAPTPEPQPGDEGEGVK